MAQKVVNVQLIVAKATFYFKTFLLQIVIKRLNFESKEIWNRKSVEIQVLPSPTVKMLMYFKIPLMALPSGIRPSGGL